MFISIAEEHYSKEDMAMHPSPAQACWQQRFVLADCCDRMLALHKAVNSPTDMSLFQLTQLMALAFEFAPDVILELGRGYGNSTCAFTEVANRLKPQRCNVLSLCNSGLWERETLPRIRQVVPESWFEPLHALHADILEFDYQQALANYHKILVFWDAHGYDVAECVLGQILPIIASRPHVVIMHDLSDARYLSPSSSSYGEHGLWKGGGGNARLRIGHIDSEVEQAVAIADFASRNRLPLHSADHSLHTELGDDPARMAELQEVLGDQLFSLEAHWFWFSLNEVSGSYTFPRFSTKEEVRQSNKLKLCSELENLGLDDHEVVQLLRLLKDYPALCSELENLGLDDREVVLWLKLIKNYPALCSYLTSHPDLVADLEFIRKEFGRLSLKSKIGLAPYIIWKALRGKYNLRGR